MKWITLIVLFFSTNLWSQTYLCSINLAKPGTTVPRAEVKNYIRDFHFNFTKDKGKKVKFKDVSVLILAQADTIIVKLINTKTKVEVSTFYKKTQKEFRLIMSGHKEVNCKTQDVWDKQDKVGLATIQHKNIKKTKLDEFKELVIFKVKTPLVFKYNQKQVSGRMRPIIFQEGYVYTADHELDQTKNWCILTFQVKRDEDTTIQKYTELIPDSFRKYSNNETSTSYSYSFVNASTGKKGLENSRWAAFSFECLLKKEAVFTLKEFHTITGYRFEVIPRS